MNKVAVYCRVSTQEQRERQSIEIQIEQAKEYCQKNELLITDYYLDDGVSGTIPFDERLQGNRLLEDAKLDTFKNVLIWKIDRLGRDTKNSLIVAHSLRDLGIGIISVTEPFDTSTAMGEFMFTQLASFAKLERDNIRERSIAGTNRVAKLGKWLGGIVPYGYFVDEDRNLTLNENKLHNLSYSEVEVIEMIYGWIGKDGLSTIEVAKRLNAMNIPTHYSKDGRKFIKPLQNFKPSEREISDRGKRKVNTSRLWHPHRIGHMVKNTTYMGIHQYGKRSKEPREIIERKVPAIVSPELWNKASITLKNNFLWAKRNTKRQYLLRGLIRCGICGRNLSGAYRKPTAWYRCNGKLIHVEIAAGKKVCNLKSIRGEWIENLVWTDIKEWILNPVSLERVLNKSLKDYEKVKGKYFVRLKHFKEDLEKKEDERANILALYRKDIITMKDVEEQYRSIEKDKDSLQLMITEMKSKILGDFSTTELAAQISSQIDVFKEQLKAGNISYDLKRKIIELFVKDVVVCLVSDSDSDSTNKDNKHTVLIDTIPLREGVVVEPRTQTKAGQRTRTKKVTTVYLRFQEQSYTEEQRSTLPPQLEGNSVNIYYRFPLPNKEISSIVQHTFRDSSQLQALELPDMLLK